MQASCKTSQETDLIIPRLKDTLSGFDLSNPNIQ